MPPASTPSMVRCDVHPGQLSCPCPQNPNTSGPQLTIIRTSSAPGHHPSPQAIGAHHSMPPMSTTPPNGQTSLPAHVPGPGTGLLAYPRPSLPGLPPGLAAAGLGPGGPAPGAGGTQGEGPVYNSPYASLAAAAAAQAYGPLAADPAALYSGLGSGYELKDSAEAIRALASNPYYSAYEGSLAGYPYSYGPMDLDVASRRKTATRENTNTLKAWLYEHRKNPYPTKGEKIMLAIITRMTLTQVSTWFANARRRLKKDNKMTWTERGNGNDPDSDVEGCHDDDDDDKDGVLDVTGDDDPLDHERLPGAEWPGDRLMEEDGRPSLMANRLTGLTGSDSTSSHHFPADEREDIDPSGRSTPSSHLNGVSPLRPPVSPSTSQASPRSTVASPMDRPREDYSRTPPATHNNNNTNKSQSSPTKPKIWSLADVATSTSTTSSPPPASTSSSSTSSAPSHMSLPAQIFSPSHGGHPHGFPALYGALRPWLNGSAFPPTHPGYLMTAAAVAANKGLSTSGSTQVIHPSLQAGIPTQYGIVHPHMLPGFRMDALTLSRVAAAGGHLSTSSARTEANGDKSHFAPSPKHTDTLRRPSSPGSRLAPPNVLMERYRRDMRTESAPYTAFKPVPKKVATL